jgi:isocitrate dehydrogenase
VSNELFKYIQGTVVVTDDAGNTIFSHSVEPGDIWRMCQTKDEPIKVSLLSVSPSFHLSGVPGI